MPWYTAVTRLVINPPLINIPDHGFRPAAGRIGLMKQLLRFSLKAFRRHRMRDELDHLTRSFAGLRIEVESEEDEEEEEGDDHNNDGQGGPSGGGPSESGPSGGGGPSGSG